MDVNKILYFNHNSKNKVSTPDGIDLILFVSSFDVFSGTRFLFLGHDTRGSDEHLSSLGTRPLLALPSVVVGPGRPLINLVRPEFWSSCLLVWTLSLLLNFRP